MLRILVALLLAGQALSVAARPALNAGAQWQDRLMVSWAEFEVEATPEQAFAVLTDYDRQPGFLPGVRSSRVVARDGVRVEIEQELEESMLMFRQRVKVRIAIVETAPRHLTLALVSGDFRSYDGFYALEPVLTDGGGPRTRITYHARFEPGFDLPRMLGPFVVKRSLERNLGALVVELQRRVADASVALPNPSPP